MIKPVSFKDIKEKDIIDYLEENGYSDNFSYYVKGLIKEDMKKSESKENKSSKRKVDFGM